MKPAYYTATSSKADASPAAANRALSGGLVCPDDTLMPRACRVEFQAWLVPAGSRQHVCGRDSRPSLCAVCKGASNPVMQECCRPRHPPFVTVLTASLAPLMAPLTLSVTVLPTFSRASVTGLLQLPWAQAAAGRQGGRGGLAGRLVCS